VRAVCVLENRGGTSVTRLRPRPASCRRWGSQSDSADADGVGDDDLAGRAPSRELDLVPARGELEGAELLPAPAVLALVGVDRRQLLAAGIEDHEGSLGAAVAPGGPPRVDRSRLGGRQPEPEG